MLYALGATLIFGTSFWLYNRCSSLINSILPVETDCESLVFIPTIGRVQITRDVIGAGSFSLVLVGLALDRVPQTKVAVKIGMTDRAGIAQDSWILSTLNGTANFPIYFGTTEVRCRKSLVFYTRPVLVMELLGLPVDIVARSAATESESYRARVALEIGRGVLDGIEIIHKRLGIIMHDIYARNIVLGFNETGIVPRIIDFGESLLIKSGNREYHQLNSLYTSTREDRNEPLGPRDDIERIVYLMIYIARGGTMPWHSLEGDKLILEKARMDYNTVCMCLPDEILQLLVYARSGITDAAEIPNYEYARNLIDTSLSKISM